MKYNNFLGLVLAWSMVVHAQETPSPVPYQGLKKTVSIDQFQMFDPSLGAGTADGMTAMLTAALVNDGRFVVVERPALSAVQAEQMLGQMGVATAETSVRQGQLIGASAIVRAAVTKYQPAASGGGINMGGLPFGMMSFLGAGAGLKSQTGMIEISLRLIDTSTGQVISTSSAQGTASSTSADVTLVDQKSGLSVGGGAFQNSPIGQAGEQAVIKAVEQIAAGMRKLPWTAMVIDANNRLVYVNAGTDRNVQVGMTMQVYRKGKVFTDPATGEVLDVNMERTATLRIDSTREKLSTAALVTGDTPMRGDIVRFD